MKVRPHLRALAVRAAAIFLALLVPAAGPGNVRAAGESAKVVEFDSWRITLPKTSEELKASEVREDSEQAGGRPCAAVDLEGRLEGDSYPELFGRFATIVDLNEYKTLEFSYKIISRGDSPPPVLQFEIHDAYLNQGVFKIYGPMIVDGEWNQFEIPLENLKGGGGSTWDMANARHLGFALRFAHATELNLTFKVGGVRLKK